MRTVLHCVPLRTARTSQQQNQLQFEKHQAQNAQAKKEEQKEMFEHAFNEQRNRVPQRSHHCPHLLMLHLLVLRQKR